ncbi:MAG TPA: glycoside hydrolase family 44 protein [Candidatus Kapabacteria bacterium]|nr:glycoside hydrolase family 44 protein [Candidatus Kapabacteria bacterium]HPO63748.1 glycoside hydrolase family 44 protein [Candidatus Kapabacteria bacterium]
MKKLTLIIIFLVFIQEISAQLKDTLIIFPNEISHSISPYIFGSNGDVIPNVITARRFGGNRTTGYNWVNNASSAGEDWYNSNDNYLTWTMGIPEEQANETGIVLKTFHQQSIESNSISLITLPMSGYVAKDKNGTVEENETAPSSRWAVVTNRKNSDFSLSPDINSDTIFVDECLNFLIHNFGNSQSPTGIKAYALDNEPSLWSYTHPRIHKEKVLVSELIQRTLDLSKTIKDIDSKCLVFGPVLYGFNAYLTLQDAPDWNFYSKYDNFIDAYLSEIKKESNLVNKNLVDVLDVHWYPEPEGVYSGDTSREASIRRMQATRSLWDSSYVEDSWIGEWFAPVAILKKLKSSIERFSPETKLAITEYDYSASNHISGAIAQADVLGNFCRENIFLSTKWGDITGFIKSAFEIFRNYDNVFSSFSDLYVNSKNSNKEDFSFYTSLDSKDSSTVHLIAINKNYDSEGKISLNINSEKRYEQILLYRIESSDSLIRQVNVSNIFSENNLELVLPPLSVSHYIFKAKSGSCINERTEKQINIIPNPANNYIEFSINEIFDNSIITITDLSGRILIHKDLENVKQRIDVSKLDNGFYFIRVQNKNQNYYDKFLIAR